jgi:hypothetical protein
LLGRRSIGTVRILERSASAGGSPVEDAVFDFAPVAAPFGERGRGLRLPPTGSAMVCRT